MPSASGSGRRPDASVPAPARRRPALQRGATGGNDRAVGEATPAPSVRHGGCRVDRSRMRLVGGHSAPAVAIRGPQLPVTPDAAAVPGPAWLRARRSGAAERFATTPLPTDAEEGWRFSPIPGTDLDRVFP